MPADNEQGSFLQQTLRGNDPLAKVAGFWAEVAGRQLSPNAMACMVFLTQHTPDVAEQIMALKKFQATPSQINEFTRESSRAQAQKEQAELMAQMRQQG